MELTCARCGEDFEPYDFPFGDDVQCPHCGTWLNTDMEESHDSLYAWVTGVSEEQNQGKGGETE